MIFYDRCCLLVSMVLDGFIWCALEKLPFCGFYFCAGIDVYRGQGEELI